MQTSTSLASLNHPARHAAPPEGALVAGTAMPREFLSFKLGEEEYGIDILRVQEIRSYEPPTRIANAPDFIKGVLNLRGLVIPIVDLRMRLGCAQAAFGGSTVVIVLNVRGRVIGAVVDAVSDVVTLDAADVKPAPAMSTAINTSFILGMGCLSSSEGERMLILTDIERLMSSADMGLFDAVVQ